MKHLALVLIALVTIGVQAQKNVFLERDYWKEKPNQEKISSDIQKGNSPSQLNSNAFDATVYAILEAAPLESIQFLLTQPGNGVNKITHDGRTYIFWAAYKGNTELMQVLLEKGAKTDLQDDHGFTIANFAAANGQANTKVYDLCIEKGANIKEDLDHNGANALLLVAPYDKDFMLIQYFISKGADLKSTDANGNTAFHYAAKAGDINFLKALVAKGVSFTDNAMIFASQGTRNTSNGLPLYQYLESLKIKPTAIGSNGENALHAIVKKDNQLEIIHYFLDKGVDVNQPDNEGNTAFMNAAGANANPDIINVLVSRVKNINQSTKKGMTALAFAIRSNTPEIVGILIRKNADVTVSDASGDNLAAYLVSSYQPQKAELFEEKLKLLQSKGFDVTVPQQNGNTLYHLAVAKNDLALLKRIASFKIDVNAKNKEGYTALHKAAMTAQNDTILKYLLDIGAQKDDTTHFKETAYDLASENENLKKIKTSIDFLK